MDDDDFDDDHREEDNILHDEKSDDYTLLRQVHRARVCVCVFWKKEFLFSLLSDPFLAAALSANTVVVYSSSEI